MENQIAEALELIEILKEDQDCSKKLGEGLTAISTLLKGDLELRVQKGVHALEELDLQGMPSHLRSQVWELISFLESFA
ncbi:hypothetical protein HOC01_02200 [archaeon]|jgi:uncharacterized protein (UPF0147 family)|nr:hypothetical protein [archaeon]MBT6697870.1 hypothetical protein [archaeon]